MLVLSRKANEEIVIGGNIVIRVLKLQGTRVGLGIEAPLEIDIWRAEVFSRIESEEMSQGAGPISAER